MANYDASIRVSTKVDTSQMQKLQIQIDKATGKVENLTKKYSELKNKKVPTEEFAALESKLQSAQSELQKLNEQKTKFVEIGFGEDMLSGVNREISEVQKKIAAITVNMKKMEDTGKAFTIGSNPEELAKIGKDLSIAQAELRALTTKQEESLAKQTAGYEKMAKSGRKAFNALNSGAKSTNGLLATLASRFKGIALSLFIFNWITKGFNAMVSSMQQGFRNLARYSDDYNKNMSNFKSELETMKNSMAAAFAPLVNMVLPYLTQFVAWINTACDSVARFLAMLQGKDTYTRAKKQVVDYKKSLESATKAVAKLAGFDDLNVLQDSDSGGGNASASSMFEEAKVGQFTGFWGELVEDLKTQDWSGAFNTVLEKLDEKLKEISWTELGQGIGDFLIGLDWAQILEHAGIVLSIPIQIAFGFGVGIGNALAGTDYTAEEVWEYFLGITWDDVKNVAVQAFTDVKERATYILSLIGASLAGGFSKVQRTVIGIFDKIKKGITEKISGIFTKWNETINKMPAPVRMLANLLKYPINGIISMVEKMINFLISGFNGLISKMNAFRFEIPDWVPDIGGKSFGFSLIGMEPVTLPRLATGGIATKSVLANIGEAGREAVLPLENNTGWMDDLADKLAARMPSGVNGPVYLQIDGKTFAKLNLPYINQENKRIGVNLRTT